MLHSIVLYFIKTNVDAGASITENEAQLIKAALYFKGGSHILAIIELLNQYIAGEKDIKTFPSKKTVLLVNLKQIN